MERTKIEIRSDCATSPSLGGGKEALDDKAIDEARATVSRRRSSIAMRLAGVVSAKGVGAVEGSMKATSCTFSPLPTKSS